ncbi:MAG: GNAT family N-acetyltransferase [Proteobacteria bacterium]|nr:GNAT family N-acetyltransferase [Pseudomonadota bacterium]
MSTTIRSARPGDWPALTELYNHYVLKTSITFDVEPYTVETRRPWFEQFAETGRYRLHVAERDGQIAGYAASSRFRPKRAYDTSVETSIYLQPDCHGQGIGTLLYTALFESLRGEDIHRALGGITLPNAASIALHRRFGFESTGVLHEVGRKLDRYWDVEWFEKAL